MNFGRIVGKVVASRRVPGFSEPLLLLVQPLDENLLERGGAIVAAAPVGPPGQGDLVYYVSGSDATSALSESFQPVDAAVVGLVDGYREARPPTKAETDMASDDGEILGEPAPEILRGEA